jgi:protein TonB
MFEDATFDSRSLHPSQTPKWMLLALAVNLTLVSTLVVLPLIYPEALPARLFQSAIEAPPPVLVTRQQPATSAAASAHSQSPRNPYLAPRVTPTQISTRPDNNPPPSSEELASMPDGVPGSTGQAFFFLAHPPTVVHPPQPVKAIVSGGVTEGLLIYRTTPIYPPIAIAAHASGTVILAATISKTGVIEDLHVLSGPLILRQAAMNAVQYWRYRPYLLNNQPVEVETTVNVVFSLDNR